jgi:hypothetical protein
MAVESSRMWSFIDDAIALGDRALTLGERAKAISLEGHDADLADRVRAQLAWGLESVKASYVDSTSELLLRLPEESSDIYSRVELAIDTAFRPDAQAIFSIQIDYQAPCRRTVHDSYIPALNGREQVIQFRVPYFEIADVSVHIWAPPDADVGEETRIRAVTVANGGSPPRSFAVARGPVGGSKTCRAVMG